MVSATSTPTPTPTPTPPSAGRRAAGPGAAEAARVLALLWEITHLDLLMVTRAEPEDDVQHVESALVGGQPRHVPDQVWSGSLCTRLAAGQGPSVAPDLDREPAYAGAANLVGTDLSCYVGAVVRRADGTLYGTVCGFGRTPRDDAMHALQPSFEAAAALLSSIIAAAQLAEERLAEAEAAHTLVLLDALTDPVTGLLNRTGLERATARESARQQRYQHLVAVVVCDVDGLKTVNDTDGHDAGDRLLRAVGARLRGAVRPRDVLARSGGDEFVLLLPGQHHDGPVVDRVRAAVADLPVSTGAADTLGGEPLGNRPLADVRAEADAAMYRAKQARKSSPAPRTVGAGTAVLAGRAPVGRVQHVFRELASGAPSWATVLADPEGVVVAVPLAADGVVGDRLVLPYPRARVLAAPRLRSARVMSERERLGLAAWYA